jgi:hypothetical protein
MRTIIVDIYWKSMILEYFSKQFIHNNLPTLHGSTPSQVLCLSIFLFMKKLGNSEVGESIEMFVLVSVT